MKGKNHKKNSKWFTKYSNPKSLMFHIAGIAAIIWFLVRVVPKPDRIRYPCQQMSIITAITYITFWSIMFQGVILFIKKVKKRTTKFVPALLVAFIVMFSTTSMVFGQIYSQNNPKNIPWNPVPKEPMGTPTGLNPGRVVWVWNPNATSKFLKGFWWLKENNNQEVINQMFIDGICNLAGYSDIYIAWDSLFRYFNEKKGYGPNSYHPGEKIAIKINLNNCWLDLSYKNVDNDRDANPYVVKALLRQLIDIVGVPEEDITVYDASRKMFDWFYNRAYYESYPSSSLVPEFPNVHFVDAVGGASGREKVIPSDEKIYFADETGLTRTLPTCVTEAKYLINMPILKRHPIDNGVTLSGKNFFGTWIEPVAPVHDYHRQAFTMGNLAPQTDLLAHKQLGGKTLLYIGDGLFATKTDHKKIGKFKMKPFNNDWTNSLFFSQDPVAIDSVMYDFLYAEGTNPCEGSHNYLHQCAEPPENSYDPENDGIYLSESLGVHEHWDTSFDIWDPERYSGVNNSGIDFVPIGKEHVKSISRVIESRHVFKNDIFLRFSKLISLDKLLKLIKNKNLSLK